MKPPREVFDDCGHELRANRRDDNIKTLRLRVRRHTRGGARVSARPLAVRTRVVFPTNSHAGRTIKIIITAPTYRADYPRH